MIKYDIIIRSGERGHGGLDECDLCIQQGFKSIVPLRVGDQIVVQGGELFEVIELTIGDGEEVIECNVRKVYEAEELKYKRLLRELAFYLRQEDNLSQERLKRFAIEWDKDE